MKTSVIVAEGWVEGGFEDGEGVVDEGGMAAETGREICECEAADESLEGRRAHLYIVV